MTQIYDETLRDQNSQTNDYVPNLSLGEVIRTKVMKTLETNAIDKSGALISEIHPDINVRLNSVNVLVGKQSLGKTVVALEEIIKISLLGTHHLLILTTLIKHFFIQLYYLTILVIINYFLLKNNFLVNKFVDIVILIFHTLNDVRI